MRALPGWAIIESEEKRKEGILELPDSAKTDMQKGTIIDVNALFIKSTTSNPILIEELSTGQRVVFKKYHDQDLEEDGRKYKIVPIDQIMVIL